MSSDYKYTIAQCDVPPERRSQLESYRAKRQRWLNWLNADEHHPDWATLSSMVWTDVSYRTLRQTVIDHDTKSEATCLNNALLAEQIIDGYAFPVSTACQAESNPDLTQNPGRIDPDNYRELKEGACLHTPACFRAASGVRWTVRKRSSAN